MKAADVMVKDIISVGPGATVREVASLMLERRIRRGAGYSLT
jgi:CBS domain-containing protein